MTTAIPFKLGCESAADLLLLNDLYGAAFDDRDYSTGALEELLRETASSEPPRYVGDDVLLEPPSPPYYDQENEMVTTAINWNGMNIVQAAAGAAQVAKQIITAAGRAKAARGKQAGAGVAPPASARNRARLHSTAPPPNRRNSWSSTSSSSSGGTSSDGSGSSTPTREPPSPAADLPPQTIERCHWLAREVVDAIVAQRARDGYDTTDEEYQRWYANLFAYLTVVDDTLPTTGRNPGITLAPFFLATVHGRCVAHARGVRWELVGAVAPVVRRRRFDPAALTASVQAAVAYVFGDDDHHRAAEFYRMYVSAPSRRGRSRNGQLLTMARLVRCRVPGGTASRRTTSCILVGSSALFASRGWNTHCACTAPACSTPARGPSATFRPTWSGRRTAYEPAPRMGRLRAQMLER